MNLTTTDQPPERPKPRHSHLSDEELTALQTPFTLADRVESNYSFALCLLGRDPTRFDLGRLQAAKELALDAETFAVKTAKYHTTIVPKRCECPDHMYRGNTCKHMLAVMLEGCIFA